MEVRCERCRTEYDFDDAKITEAGTAVKCTVCGHVFKVKKKALVVTEPLKPEQAAALESEAAGAKPRDWKVRQANGNVFTFKELTTLQKWIVERKVVRDDEISLTGESWKRLGNIAELASFFQVVEAADRAAAVPPPQPIFTPPPQHAFVPAPPQPAPAAYPVQPAAQPPAAPAFAQPYSAPAAPQQPAAPVIQVQVQAPPAPPPVQRNVDLEDEELRAIRGSGTGKWVVIAAVLVGCLIGGGIYFKTTRVDQPPPPPPAPEPAAKAPEPPDASAPEVVQAPAIDAGQPEAAAAVDAGPAVAAKPPEPQPAAAQAPRSFEWYIEAAYRKREVGDAAAALALYEKAGELDPDSAEVPSGKGYSLLDLGRTNQALASFQEALKRNPRFQEALLGSAETYKELGNKAKAIEFYQRYLDQAPEGSEADLARGAIERLKAD